jgi:hypothetical protein
MARYSPGQKAERVLRFLMGLRYPRVAAALRQHGFSNADRLEGYELLRRLTDDRLDAVAVRAADPDLLERLDTFENKWLPIADATLRRHFPEARDWLFRNLTMTEGLDLIVSVGTFIRRLDQLPTEAPEGKEARALLTRRGLDEHALALPREALAELQVEPEAEPRPPITPEETAAREKALWDWYLEWSTIAQQSIKDRRLLRALGYLSKTGSGTEELEDESAPGGGEPAGEGVGDALAPVA